MKYIILFLLLVCLSGVQGQSLRSIKTDTYSKYIPKSGRVKQITTKSTSYLSSRVKSTKRVYDFSKGMDTITDKRYEDGELRAELIFVFTPNKKLKNRTYKQKLHNDEWQYHINEYEYDLTGRVSSKQMDVNGRQMHLALIKNDSLSNPIEMKLFDSSNRLKGYETAEYDYDNNKWTYRVFDRDGYIKSSKQYSIKSNKNRNLTYNEQGDCVYQLYRLGKIGQIDLELAYKYDEQGNWIQKKIYELKVDRGKVKERRLKSKSRRKIIYLVD